jgi:hypothetical protein
MLPTADEEGTWYRYGIIDIFFIIQVAQYKIERSRVESGVFFL